MYQVQASAATAAGGGCGQAGGWEGHQPRHQHGHRQAGAADIARRHQWVTEKIDKSNRAIIKDKKQIIKKWRNSKQTGSNSQTNIIWYKQNWYGLLVKALKSNQLCCDTASWVHLSIYVNWSKPARHQILILTVLQRKCFVKLEEENMKFDFQKKNFPTI